MMPAHQIGKRNLAQADDSSATPSTSDNASNGTGVAPGAAPKQGQLSTPLPPRFTLTHADLRDGLPTNKPPYSFTNLHPLCRTACFAGYDLRECNVQPGQGGVWHRTGEQKGISILFAPPGDEPKTADVATMQQRSVKPLRGKASGASAPPQQQQQQQQAPAVALPLAPASHPAQVAVPPPPPSNAPVIAAPPLPASAPVFAPITSLPSPPPPLVAAPAVPFQQQQQQQQQQEQQQQPLPAPAAPLPAPQAWVPASMPVVAPVASLPPPPQTLVAAPAVPFQQQQKQQQQPLPAPAPPLPAPQAWVPASAPVVAPVASLPPPPVAPVAPSQQQQQQQPLPAPTPAPHPFELWVLAGRASPPAPFIFPASGWMTSLEATTLLASRWDGGVFLHLWMRQLVFRLLTEKVNGGVMSAELAECVWGMI